MHRSLLTLNPQPSTLNPICSLLTTGKSRVCKEHPLGSTGSYMIRRRCGGKNYKCASCLDDNVSRQFGFYWVAVTVRSKSNLIMRKPYRSLYTHNVVT